MSTTIVSPVTEVTRTNYVRNPRAIESGANWWGSYSGLALTRSWVSGISTLFPEVTTAVRITISAVTAEGYLYLIPLPTVTGTGTTGMIPVSPGDTVTAGMLVWASWATGVRMSGQWRDANNVYISNNTDDALQAVPAGDHTTSPGTWLTTTGVAPEGAAYFVPQAGVATGDRIEAVGDWIQGTAAIAEVNGSRVPTVGDYFDGASTPSGRSTFAWVGTPHASASVQIDPLQATPDLVMDYAYQREARTIAHTVLDRSDPDITLRPVGLRTGTLNMWCKDRATATDVENLHRQSLPLTLDASEDEPTASMVYVPTGSVGVSWDDLYDKWLVTSDYAEVSQ